jgi:hypothetical protein
MTQQLDKIELCSCNLLECLQQAYSGTLLQSASSAATTRDAAETDEDDRDDRSAHTSTTNVDIALDRLFADSDRVQSNRRKRKKATNHISLCQ